MTSTTNATNTSTGSLIVAGGVGIAKNMYIGSSSNSTSTTSGALTIAGGVGIAKDMYVGGSSFLNSQVKITGTASSPSLYVYKNSLSNNIVVEGSTSGMILQDNSVVNAGYMTYDSNVLNFGITRSIGSETFVKIARYADVPAHWPGGLYLSGGYGTPVSGKMIIGDGGGWRFIMASKNLGVETDRFVFTDTGGFSAVSKSFEIPHPDPSKVGYKLKHCTIETNTGGDNMYRYKIQTNNLKATIQLPSYFNFLNENPQVFVTCDSVLGCGKGMVTENIVNIDVSNDGIYNVLIIGTRKDECAKKAWNGAEIPP